MMNDKQVMEEFYPPPQRLTRILIFRIAITAKEDTPCFCAPDGNIASAETAL